MFTFLFSTEFIAGLLIGGVIAIFVYRNNKAKMSKYADKIDELWDELPGHIKNSKYKYPK